MFFLERLDEGPDSGRARCEGLDACLPEPDDAPRAALSSGSAPSRHAAPDPPRQRLRPLTSPKSTLFKMQAAKAKAAAKQAAIKKKQGQPHSPPPPPAFFLSAGLSAISLAHMAGLELVVHTRRAIVWRTCG